MRRRLTRGLCFNRVITGHAIRGSNVSRVRSSPSRGPFAPLAHQDQGEHKVISHWKRKSVSMTSVVQTRSRVATLRESVTLSKTVDGGIKCSARGSSNNNRYCKVLIEKNKHTCSGIIRRGRITGYFHDGAHIMQLHTGRGFLLLPRNHGPRNTRGRRHTSIEIVRGHRIRHHHRSPSTVLAPSVVVAQASPHAVLDAWGQVTDATNTRPRRAVQLDGVCRHPLPKPRVRGPADLVKRWKGAESRVFGLWPLDLHKQRPRVVCVR